MPRKPRELVPGGIYHVFARGNRREAIFIDDSDRRHFIVTGPGRALLVDAGSGDDRVWGGSRHLPGPRTVTLPARSVRPLLCGLGHDRVKVARGQAVRSCEGRLS